MQYRSLAGNGASVSPLCLGAMMFGGVTDEATAGLIAARAFERGINFIDTADIYASGRSEEVVGRLIADRRDKWVLATKFGGEQPSSDQDRGSSPSVGARQAIRAAVEASLRRLGSDYIDLLYLHRENLDFRAEEIVRALGDLIQTGKIRYWGLSNHRAWKVAQFCHTADALGVDRPAASQPLYSLANRQVEQEHLAACVHYEVSVVPYSPLARDALTTNCQSSAADAADTRDGRDDKRMNETEWQTESPALAREIEGYAQARGLTAGQFAVAWVLANKLVTSAVAGPRTLEQWEDYVPALDYCWSAEDEAMVDRLVPASHPSIPGYSNFGHSYAGHIL